MIVTESRDINSSGSEPRFIDCKAKAKKFLKLRRNYKLPDFSRMILDLRKLGWSHEKIAFVLDVSNASTVSAWSTGSKPSYEYGEQFIMLWQDQTGVERFPRIGEWATYRYKIGQLDFIDELDGVIDQLDSEIKK